MLDGTVAVVTAAAGAGVGNAVARRLRDEGAIVVISDVHERRLERAAADLGVDGAVVDVGEPGAVERHVADVLDRHGRIDVLVSCAGINVVKSAWELSEDEWRRILDVNLTAPFLAARAGLPSMLARGRGSLIHIASIAAWLSSLGESAYGTTKAGLLGLTRALALETAGRGVPGLVDNPYLQTVYGPERVAELRARIPMGRAANPAEVAAAVAWLASDESAYVTGECITLAGGWYMRA